MVKLIPILLLVAGLSWYWLKDSLKTEKMIDVVEEVQESATDDKAIYLQIQENLKTLITENVKKKLPEATDILFKSFRITSLHADQVKADFLYTFNDRAKSKDNIEVDGFAILNRVPQEEENYELWKVERVQVLRNHVSFDEGIVTKVSTK